MMVAEYGWMGNGACIDIMSNNVYYPLVNIHKTIEMAIEIAD